MSERRNVLLAKKAVENACMEQELSCTFYPAEYPLRMTIKPYTGVGSQMSLLENMENRGISPKTCVTFTADCEEGTQMAIEDKYKTGYDKFAKLKKKFDDLCRAWRELICFELNYRGHVEREDLMDMYENLQE